MLRSKTKGQIGISVDGDAVRAVIVQNNQVVWHGSEVLEPGTTIRGKVIDESRVGDAIRRLLSRAKSSNRNLKVTWSSGGILHNTIPLPEGIKRREDLRSALLLDATQSFSPLDPATLHMHVYTAGKGAGVLAVNQSQFASLMESAKFARAKMVSIVPEAVALSSHVQKSAYHYGIIYFGHDNTVYAQFVDEKLSYIRALPVGLADAVEILTSQFAGNWDLATRALLEVGLDGEFADELLAWQDMIAQELENTVNQSMRAVGIRPDILYTAGPGSSVPGLFQSLQGQLPVALDRAEIDLEWGQVPFPEHALYLGAVLASLNNSAYNLLADETSVQTVQKEPEFVSPGLVIENEDTGQVPWKRALISTLLCVLAISGLWWTLGWAKQQETQQQQDAMQRLEKDIKQGQIDIVAPEGYQQRMGQAKSVWQSNEQMNIQTERMNEIETRLTGGNLRIDNILYDEDSYQVKGSGDKNELEAALGKLEEANWQVEEPKFIGLNWDVVMTHE